MVLSWLYLGFVRFRGPNTPWILIFGRGTGLVTALRASRLELGGDVYAVVFESWEVTRWVLHDPFTASRTLCCPGS